MLGSFTIQIPANVPRGGHPTGAHPAAKDATDNARAGAHEHKARAAPFQSFMSSEGKGQSLDRPAEAGDLPGDDPALKGEAAEGGADISSEQGDDAAENEQAESEAQPFEPDLVLGAAEVQKHEDRARLHLSLDAASEAGAGRDLSSGGMMRNASNGGGALSGQSFAAWSLSQASDSAVADRDAETEARGATPQSGAALAQSSPAAAPHMAGALPLNLAPDSGLSSGPGMIADVALALPEPSGEMILRPDGAPLGVSETRSPAFTTFQGAQTAQHVASQLLYAMIRSSERSIDLMLNPAELGRVRLTLLHGEMGMVVNIAAERGETLELMRRHSAVLGQEFQDMGYGDTDFTFTQERQADGRGQAQSNAPAGIIHQPEPLPTDADPVWLSPADRLDIRL